MPIDLVRMPLTKGVAIGDGDVLFIVICRSQSVISEARQFRGLTIGDALEIKIRLRVLQISADEFEVDFIFDI